MVGPARGVRGGVSAVANTLLESMPGDAPSIRYIATHTEGPKALKFIIAVFGICNVVLTAAFWPFGILHIHVASNASFTRKNVVAAVGHALGKKVILHVHGGGFADFFDHGSLPLKRRISARLAAADLVIGLSERWQSRLKSMSPGADVRVLTNPVDILAYTEATRLRPQPKAAGGRLLFLGALVKRKGVWDLVEAVARVAAERPDAILELAGSASSAELRRLIDTKAVNKNVRFLGWIQDDDKLAAFGRAHMLVLPSYIEGLPVVLLEAMAAGLPVVATRVGGIPDLVEDGVNGFLIEPGDVEALSESILRLLSDTELRHSMGAAGLRLVGDKHDVRVVTRTLVDWYDEITAPVS